MIRRCSPLPPGTLVSVLVTTWFTSRRTLERASPWVGEGRRCPFILRDVGKVTIYRLGCASGVVRGQSRGAGPPSTQLVGRGSGSVLGLDQCVTCNYLCTFLHRVSGAAPAPAMRPPREVIWTLLRMAWGWPWSCVLLVEGSSPANMS